MPRKPLWVAILLAAGFFAGICLGVASLAVLDTLGVSIQLPAVTPRIKTAPEVGRMAPAIELVDLNGTSLRLEDYRSQPVMVNFWATWCGPCVAEIPYIKEAYASYGNQVKILAVNVGEDPSTVSRFASQHGMKFSILLDSDGFAERLYRLRGYPTTFFIDSEGVIQVIELGSMTKAVLINDLKSIGVVP